MCIIIFTVEESKLCLKSSQPYIPFHHRKNYCRLLILSRETLFGCICVETQWGLNSYVNFTVSWDTQITGLRLILGESAREFLEDISIEISHWVLKTSVLINVVGITLFSGGLNGTRATGFPLSSRPWILEFLALEPGNSSTYTSGSLVLTAFTLDRTTPSLPLIFNLHIRSELYHLIF